MAKLSIIDNDNYRYINTSKDWKDFQSCYILKITFLKKLVEVAPTTYFQFDIFGIYMLWGI
jgi:hypothetical protein